MNIDTQNQAKEIATANLEKIIRLEKVIKLKQEPTIKCKFEPSIINDVPNEPLLKVFWTNIEQIYFSNIEDELSKLLYLIKRNLEEQKVSSLIYSNYKMALASNKLHKNIKFQNEIQKQNYQNFNKLLFIITEISPFFNKYSEHQIIQYYETERLLIQQEHIKTNNFEKYLKTEEAKLNSILKVISKNKKVQYFDQYLNQLENEQQEIHQDNMEKLQEIVEKVQIQLKLKQKEQRILKERNLTIEKYIQKIVIELEQQQIVESIAKIEEIYMNNNKKYFLIEFEYSFFNKRIFIESNFLQVLNSKREISLFSYYNVPQKSPLSFISSNFYGIRKIFQNSQFIHNQRGVSLLENMEKCISKINYPFVFEKINMCHHCKLLFPKQFLITCNYKSSKMGNAQYQKHYSPYYMAMPVKSKKNNKKVFFCSRTFCISCIKINYDNQLQNCYKQDWICPFCKGICFCSRCLRNDQLNKLKVIFSKINSCQEIESYFTNFNKQETIILGQSNEESQKYLGVQLENLLASIEQSNQKANQIFEIELEVENLYIAKQIFKKIKKRENIKSEILEIFLRKFNQQNIGKRRRNWGQINDRVYKNEKRVKFEKDKGKIILYIKDLLDFKNSNPNEPEEYQKPRKIGHEILNLLKSNTIEELNSILKELREQKPKQSLQLFKLDFVLNFLQF